MPQSITDVATFTSPIQSIADGDAASGANFILGPQGLANRTAYLNAIVGPGGTGVTGIRSGNAATMAALTGMTDGQVFLVQSGTTAPNLQGVYVYKSTSALTADGAFVIAASGGGQWVHELTSLLNASTGIAAVGPVLGGSASSGKLLKTLVPNRFESALSVTLTGTFGNSIASTSSASLVDATGASVTFTGAVAGDIIVVHYTGNLTWPGAGPYGAVQLMVVDNGTNQAQTQTYWQGVAGAVTGQQFSGSAMYTTSGGGSTVVKLQFADPPASSTVSLVYPFSLVAMRFRP